MSNINEREVNYLLHLLSCALNQKAPQHEEGIDFKALFRLAKMHQVYNMVFPVIADFPELPQEERDAFKNYTLSELRRTIIMANERSIIFQQLEEEKIKYMPLKGLILKDYYPKESMRQMSDNDILFDVSKRDAVAAIMKRSGYKTIATGENSDDYHKAPYATFEFHRTLFFEEKEFCPRFEHLWDNATQDSEHPYLYHMGLDDVYVYNVCHMYKHYSTAGCGVRFLADNYLFLKKEQNRLHFDRIEEQLERYGILDFEKKARALAFKIFDEEPLTEEETALLETFINFGIYGSGKIELTKSLHQLAEGSSMDEAKKQYLKARLFPSKKKMVADYRTLEKKPYLLPAFYAYRLFKGAKNSKKTLNEIKSVNDIEE